MASRPATVSRPGSPGPPPTRITRPIAGQRRLRDARWCGSPGGCAPRPGPRRAAIPELGSGGGDDQGGSGDVALVVVALLPVDVAAIGQIRERGGDRRCDHGDQGTARSQPGDHRQGRGMHRRRPARRPEPVTSKLGSRGSLSRASPRITVSALSSARLVSGSRTAMRIQSGPSPGKVSPRRTAKPWSRSASPHPAGGLVAATQPEVSTNTNGAAGRRPTVRPESARPCDQDLAVLGDLLGRGVRRSATGRRTRQAVMTARAGVDTDQGGCCAAQVGDELGVADRVARAQPGQPPGLGQRAQHEHTGRRRLIMDSGSPGTASMNASSTHSTRPGRTRRAEHGRRVQDAGRVGRVADDHEVCVVGDQRRDRGGSRWPGRGARVRGRTRRRAARPPAR